MAGGLEDVVDVLSLSQESSGGHHDYLLTCSFNLWQTNVNQNSTKLIGGAKT